MMQKIDEVIMWDRKIFSIFVIGAVIGCCRIISAATVGVIPNGFVSYAGEGELHDLLWLPWVTNRVQQYGITYCSLKCAEATPVDSRYADALLYHGTVKFAGGNVVVGFMLQKLDRNEDLPNDLFDRLLDASKDELDTVKFVKSMAPLAGDSRNVVEMGAQPLGGLTAFWNTTRMERRIGKQVVYRGLQRTYIVPLGDRKTVLSANFLVGVLGAEQPPYADFKALIPVGEKFIKSIRIRQQLVRHVKLSHSDRGENAAIMPASECRRFNSASSPSPVSQSANTRLPHDLISKITADGVKRVDLSEVRCLNSPTLNILIPFPLVLKIVPENVDEGLAIKGVKDWDKHGVRLFASVVVNDVGEKYVKELKDALNGGISKKMLSKQCESELGCKFIDGGVVRKGSCVFSWIDTATSNRNMSDCRRMITLPARDGKFLTISYALVVSGKNPPIEDFKAMTSLFDQCRDGIETR